jgi:hypothetical protein
MKPTDFMLECERRAYLATGNPLHAWNAYTTARAKDVEIPQWVLRYFDTVSCELRSIEVSEKEDLRSKVSRALGLGSVGRGTPFNEDAMWWAYGRKVRELRSAGYEKLQAAYARAAEFYGVSASTIRRGAKRYDKVFPEGDDELSVAEDNLPVFLPKQRPEVR